jgi:hypothetical protein
LDVLLDALGDDDTFERNLGRALTGLQQSDYNRQFDRHGHSGYDFSFPIDEEFVLVFRRDTDRTGQGQPIRVHFYLKTIERR